MTCPCALGETSSWWQISASSEEVYVWRCLMVGANIATADDALAIVHGAAQAKYNPLDIRGITVKPSGGGYLVDIAFTTRMWVANSTDPTRILPHWPNAKEIASAIAADPGVIARFPQLSMSGYEWLQLDGPANVVDFWRAHSILWDRALGDPRLGGPTQAYAERSGAYIGSTEDVSSLQKMPGSGVTPIGPPGTQSGKSNTALWAIGGIGAIVAIWYLSTEHK